MKDYSRYDDFRTEREIGDILRDAGNEEQLLLRQEYYTYVPMEFVDEESENSE